MRFGLFLGYTGSTLVDPTPLAVEAERLGFHSVWAAEAYGSDAVTVLAWIAARTERIVVGSGILQMPARTPAMTAMTAATLSELSGGRFALGLGLSGPQVAEGWHGMPYGKPLGRTREYVEVVRAALAREAPLTHLGEHYRIPYDGHDGTGLGVPLKLILRPAHAVPVYLAAIGPRNVALTAEIADGWLPAFYSPERAREVWGDSLAEGFAASGDESKAARFDVAANVPVVVTHDRQAARDALKPGLALYIGGMGARGRNFYNDLACRYGYEAAAARIQDLYLGGHKREAVAAVPDALVDETSLIGTVAEIRDRLAVWEEHGVTTLLASTGDVSALRGLADAAS